MVENIADITCSMLFSLFFFSVLDSYILHRCFCSYITILLLTFVLCNFCHRKTIIYYLIPVLCSIIQKASNALEVLKEVLDAVDSQHPEV